MAKTEPIERLLEPQEVAEILGVPISTLYRWKYARKGPQAIRVGKHLRYRREDVQRWLDLLAAQQPA